MTYEYEDFIERLQELYPGLTKESLRKILKEGLKTLLRHLRTGNDVIISPGMKMEGFEDYWIKFFTPIPNTAKQYRKTLKDLEIREKERIEMVERIRKSREKGKKIAAANKRRAKELRKKKAAEKKKNLTQEEREKLFIKRRKALRKARMRKIEEQKRKEQNGD